MPLHMPQNNDRVKKSYTLQFQDTFHSVTIWLTQNWSALVNSLPAAEDQTIAGQMFADHDERGPEVVSGLGVLIERQLGKTIINSGVFAEHTEREGTVFNAADAQNILANQIFGG